MFVYIALYTIYIVSKQLHSKLTVHCWFNWVQWGHVYTAGLDAQFWFFEHILFFYFFLDQLFFI